MAKVNDTVVLAYDNSEAKLRRYYIVSEFVDTVEKCYYKNDHELIYVYDFKLFCPVCSKMSRILDDKKPLFQYGNNFARPMIQCCCRCVLLMNTADIMSKDEVKEEYKSKVSEDHVFISVKLAFVKKIIDHNVGIFRCDNAVPDEVAREFSDKCEKLDHKNADAFLKTSEIAKKYDIKIDNRDVRYGDEYAKIFNLGIAVDSYDIENPTKPYPKSTNTSPHDDTFVKLLCVDEDGDDFYTEYGKYYHLW